MPKSIRVVPMKSLSTSPTSGRYLFSEFSPHNCFSYFHHVNLFINRYIYNGFYINPLACKGIRNGIYKPIQVKKIKGTNTKFLVNHQTEKTANPHRGNSFVEELDEKTYPLISCHSQTGDYLENVGIHLQLRRIGGYHPKSFIHGGDVKETHSESSFFTGKMILVSESLASPTSLEESIWVKE